MTPLTKQLEDKKKELMNLQIELHKEDRRNIQDIILDEVRLKAEIAILEQAIAEKKEFIRLLKERIPDNLEGGHTHEVIDELARDKWL